MGGAGLEVFSVVRVATAPEHPRVLLIQHVTRVQQGWYNGSRIYASMIDLRVALTMDFERRVFASLNTGRREVGQTWYDSASPESPEAQCATPC